MKNLRDSSVSSPDGKQGTAHDKSDKDKVRETPGPVSMKTTKPQHWTDVFFQSTLDGFILTDIGGQLIEMNSAYCEMTGYSRDELLGMNIRDLEAIIPPSEIEQAIQGYVSAGEARFNTRHRRKDGSLIDLEVSIVTIPAGSDLRIAAFVRDITLQRENRKALQESANRYQSLFLNSPIALWLEDYSGVKTRIDELKLSGVKDFKSYLEQNPAVVKELASLAKVIDVNQKCLELYEVTDRSELLGSLLPLLGTQKKMESFIHELAALAADVQEIEFDALERNFSGQPFHSHIKVQIVPGCEETWERVVVSMLDITAQKELEQKVNETLAELSNLARTDSLTGLYNRRAITKFAESEIERANRTGGSLGIMLIDMDDLKGINDSHGHQTGDAALCQLAGILNHSVRPYDRVGRWGGDEFLIVLPDVDREKALEIASRLRMMINSERLGHLVGEELLLEVSIGVTAGICGVNAELVFDQLLQQADAALYEAKSKGRNQTCVFVQA